MHSSVGRSATPLEGRFVCPHDQGGKQGREAKAEWRRVVPELARLKLLSRMTRTSMASYCETWSAFVEATKVVHEEGVVREGRSGQMVHPAFKAQMAASAELRRWAIEYPLTRASEQKVKPVEEPDVASDFD